jgi:hypothetical protein
MFTIEETFCRKLLKDIFVLRLVFVTCPGNLLGKNPFYRLPLRHVLFCNCSSQQGYNNIEENILNYFCYDDYKYKFKMF